MVQCSGPTSPSDYYRIREIIQPVLLEFNTLFIESALADPEYKKQTNKRPDFDQNVV